jgi:hypothetical protein
MGIDFPHSPREKAETGKPMNEKFPFASWQELRGEEYGNCFWRKRWELRGGRRLR